MRANNRPVIPVPAKEILKKIAYIYVLSQIISLHYEPDNGKERRKEKGEEKLIS